MNEAQLVGGMCGPFTVCFFLCSRNVAGDCLFHLSSETPEGYESMSVNHRNRLTVATHSSDNLKAV